ncbi:MAG: hypothetical protein K2M16_04225 [Muribaculaceae bacterium]|nr:hypothetical protein [Muribaculaceae bacterium]
MKLNHLIASVSLLATAVIASCGSSSSSTENCLVFGEVPSIYADYQAQRDKIEAEIVDSKIEYKKGTAQIDELKEKYRAKIEEASKKLDGQTIELIPREDFKVIKPISLSFKEFANNVNAVFTIGGEVEAAKDVTIEVTESWLRSHNVEYLYVPLLMIGCDEQEAEVTKNRIGYFKGFKVIDGKVVLPSGNKAELETVAYNKNDYDNYTKVKSVKLTLDTSKI